MFFTWLGTWGENRETGIRGCYSSFRKAVLEARFLESKIGKHRIVLIVELELNKSYKPESPTNYWYQNFKYYTVKKGKLYDERDKYYKIDF